MLHINDDGGGGEEREWKGGCCSEFVFQFQGHFIRVTGTRTFFNERTGTH
jgi:hypothetical protein